MSTTFNFEQPTNPEPNFRLKHEEKEVTLSLMEVVSLFSVDKPYNEQLEHAQLELFNKHGLRVSTSVLAMVLEKATEVYDDLKKNCMNEADSDDSGSTPAS